MGDFCVTREEREAMRHEAEESPHASTGYRADVPRLLDALAAAEAETERMREAAQVAETDAQRMAAEVARVSARLDSARPLIEAAEVFAKDSADGRSSARWSLNHDGHTEAVALLSAAEDFERGTR